MDEKTLNAEKVYERMLGNWNKLRERFPNNARHDPVHKSARTEPPNICIYGSNFAKGKLKRDFFPISSAELEERTWFPCKLNIYSLGFYSVDCHTICINSDVTKEQDLEETLAEETTHSAIQVSSSSTVAISRKELNELNGFVKGLGGLLFRVTKGINGANLYLEMEEFLGLIGQTYLLGSPSEKPSDLIKKNLRKLRKAKFLFGWINFLRPEIHSVVVSQIKHIPEIAAECLLKQYDSDVDELLENHPGILTSNGDELWKNYCVPILKDGVLY